MADDPKDTAGTPPTPPAQQGRDPQTQQMIDSAAAAARKETEEKLTRDFNAKLEQQARELEALKTKAMSEDEKKIADAVKAKEAELSASFAERERVLQLKVAIAGKVRADDVDMVAALIPKDVSADQLGAKVDEILKARPYLLAEATAAGVPPGGSPPATGGDKWGPKRVETALGSGKINWSEIDAAKAAGRWDDSL